MSDLGLRAINAEVSSPARGSGRGGCNLYQGYGAGCVINRPTISPPGGISVEDPCPTRAHPESSGGNAMADNPQRPLRRNSKARSSTSSRPDMIPATVGAT